MAHDIRSVVLPWVWRLTWKMQTVMLCSLRGCDGTKKEDPSKLLVRHIRRVVLNNAEVDVNKKAKFMTAILPLGTIVIDITEDLDHYPLHWIAHAMHACEIIAYKHPEQYIREDWLVAYELFAEAFHLLPETEKHLDLRLADAEFTPVKKQEYREIGHRVLPPPRVVEKAIEKVIGRGVEGYDG